MNVWIFSGRLGADAELRTTSGGDKVLGFRVANDVGYGERKTTQWIECSLWGKRGEAIVEYMTKGKMVIVSGEVTLREYQKRDGTNGAGLAVRVTDVEFHGTKEERDGGSTPPRADTRGGSRPSRQPPPDDLDDEIPF